MPQPKASTLVAPDQAVELTDAARSWASRAGDKLDGALSDFDIDVTGARALDVGASTGGFTDVLLTRGAASVTALDVGYGQMVWRLRSDDRVEVIDRTNFRTTDIGALDAPFNVVTIDVSFISVRLLAAQLAAAGVAGTHYVVLVKPQFEAGRDQVGRGGVVSDPAIHLGVVEGVADALTAVGIGILAAAPSVLPGAEGNREFFLHGAHGAPDTMSAASLQELVTR